MPIQIAKCEHNRFKPLSGGLELHLTADTNLMGVASHISFGLYPTEQMKYVIVLTCHIYDLLFVTHQGPVKIVSSEGKQNTGNIVSIKCVKSLLGKSSTLNHLFGSLFDVSGKRCTEGVWLTIRTFENKQGIKTMFVIMDFEGLGSIERRPQVAKNVVPKRPLTNSHTGGHLLDNVQRSYKQLDSF